MIRCLWKTYWKWIWRLMSLGIILWCITLPLTPILGFAYTWPKAQEQMQSEGITGLPLMVGGSLENSLHNENKDGKIYHQESRSRTYLVLPSFELVTYTESRSGDWGKTSQIQRGHPLESLALLGLWLLATIFTYRTIRNWIRHTVLTKKA